MSLLLLLSLPHAATSSRLAIGTVSNARRFMWWYSPLWWWVEGVAQGERVVVCHLPTALLPSQPKKMNTTRPNRAERMIAVIISGP